MTVTRDILALISPTYLGEERIGIELDPLSGTTAQKPITVNFDYSSCDPVGIVMPLEFVVQPGNNAGGEGKGYQSKVFSRVVPTTYGFVVPSAGTYIVILKERFHNRWWGKLIIEVDGDDLSLTSDAERVV